MAQKLILCEAMAGTDILAQNAEVRDSIAAGYVVSSVSGYSTPDNRHMALVLLAEPAAETTTETPADNSSDSDNSSSSETPAAEGGEGGDNEGSGGTE